MWKKLDAVLFLLSHYEFVDYGRCEHGSKSWSRQRWLIRIITGTDPSDTISGRDDYKIRDSPKTRSNHLELNWEVSDTNSPNHLESTRKFIFYWYSFANFLYFYLACFLMLFIIFKILNTTKFTSRRDLDRYVETDMKWSDRHHNFEPWLQDCDVPHNTHHTFTSLVGTFIYTSISSNKDYSCREYWQSN